MAENNLFINCEQLVSDIESMLREFEDDIEISMSAFTRHSDDPLEFVVLIINKIIDILNSIIEKINTNKKNNNCIKKINIIKIMAKKRKIMPK